MKKLFLTLWMFRLCLILEAQNPKEDDAELYVEERILSQHLSDMTQSGAKEEDTFEIPIWLNASRTPLSPKSNVQVSVEVRVPTGDQKLLKDVRPDMLPRALEGCVAEYKGGKIVVTLKRPQIFVDTRPGASSVTWLYGLQATLEKRGAIRGQGKGIKANEGKGCISYFGVVSKKTNLQWKPYEHSNYQYSIETDPKDYSALGTLDKDAAFVKGGDGKARFVWNPGTEERSLLVKWIITGELTGVEDTDWIKITNPCSPAESAPPPKPFTPPPVAATTPLPKPTTPVPVPSGPPPVAATTPLPKPTTPVPYLTQLATPPPTKPQIPTGPTPAKPSLEYRYGKSSLPFFKIAPPSDAEYLNLRRSPTSREDNIVAELQRGIIVQQDGATVTGDDDVEWMPVLYINKKKDHSLSGYIAKRYLEEQVGMLRR